MSTVYQQRLTAKYLETKNRICMVFGKAIDEMACDDTFYFLHHYSDTEYAMTWVEEDGEMKSRVAPKHSLGDEWRKLKANFAVVASMEK